MDIKGLVRNVVPLPQTVQKITERKRTETSSATDRDANGRQEQADEQANRHLSDEEFAEAVAYLEQLDGVKEHNLSVRRVVLANSNRIVYVEDSTGQVIRRLSEADLSMLLKKKKSESLKKKGNLFNRVA